MKLQETPQTCCRITSESGFVGRDGRRINLPKTVKRGCRRRIQIVCTAGFGSAVFYVYSSRKLSRQMQGGAADLMKAENLSPISRTFRGGQGCGDGDLE